MFFFLEDFYHRTHSDEIGGLVGMSLLAEGSPADPAIVADGLDSFYRLMIFDVHKHLRRLALGDFNGEGEPDLTTSSTKPH